MFTAYNHCVAPCPPPQIHEVQQPVEIPVAAFPLRGRCNPYCLYLLPLLILRILIFLSLLGALITAIIIPKDIANFNNQLTAEFLNTRIAAIVIFGVALAVTLAIFFIELLNCCNIADSKYVPIIISFLDLLFALAVLAISVALIALEQRIAANLFTTAVNQYAFLAAGILGLAAVLFYMMHLFLSRFYQFCIGNYKNFKREFLSGSIQCGPNPGFVQPGGFSPLNGGC